GFNMAVGRKELANLVLGSGKGKVADVNRLHISIRLSNRCGADVSPARTARYSWPARPSRASITQSRSHQPSMSRQKFLGSPGKTRQQSLGIGGIAKE